MSEHALKLALQRARRRRADVTLSRSFDLEVSTMASMNLSFLWEAFALASGIPPSTWQTVPGDEVAVVQLDQNWDPYRSGQQAKTSFAH
jgi:hypothetical protein